MVPPKSKMADKEICYLLSSEHCRLSQIYLSATIRSEYIVYTINKIQYKKDIHAETMH